MWLSLFFGVSVSRFFLNARHSLETSGNGNSSNASLLLSLPKHTHHTINQWTPHHHIYTTMTFVHYFETSPATLSTQTHGSFNPLCTENTDKPCGICHLSTHLSMWHHQSANPFIKKQDKFVSQDQSRREFNHFLPSFTTTHLIWNLCPTYLLPLTLPSSVCWLAQPSSSFQSTFFFRFKKIVRYFVRYISCLVGGQLLVLWVVLSRWQGRLVGAILYRVGRLKRPYTLPPLPDAQFAEEPKCHLEQSSETTTTQTICSRTHKKQYWKKGDDELSFSRSLTASNSLALYSASSHMFTALLVSRHMESLAYY